MKESLKKLLDKLSDPVTGFESGLLFMMVTTLLAGATISLIKPTLELIRRTQPSTQNLMQSSKVSTTTHQVCYITHPFTFIDCGELDRMVSQSHVNTVK